MPITLFTDSLFNLLNFSTFGGEHQLDQLFGDLRLKPFGVPLIETNDIGDDPPIFTA